MVSLFAALVLPRADLPAGRVRPMVRDWTAVAVPLLAPVGLTRAVSTVLVT